MNDWYLDPPEDEAFPDGPDQAPEDFEMPADYEPPELPARCPHGRQWHECNDCMIAGDLAFDAARERRGRR